MKIVPASIMNDLPPYPFAVLDERKQDAIDRGVDVISFAIGDPDQPTPPFIVEALIEAARNPKNHHYPSYVGMLELRERIAEWYFQRYGVKADPKTEVIITIGAKEAIANLAEAFVNPDETVLVPSPGYPVYETSTIRRRGIPYFMPLLAKNGYLPDLEDLPTAKLMWLNYPNNPTAACANKDFFERAVYFAEQNNTIIAHDFCYADVAEMGNEVESPISFMEIPGAKDVGIEFHSLSKTFNMTGWRIGFAVGNAEIIKNLGNVKNNVDSGVFQAIQMAAIRALDTGSDDGIVAIAENNRLTNSRRKRMLEGFASINVFPMGPPPTATFYLWLPIPHAFHTSLEFVLYILEKTGVLFTPGTTFGICGEGFFRVALTTDRIEEAFKRIWKNCDLFN